MKIPKEKSHLSEVLSEAIAKLQAGPLQRVDELPEDTPQSCVFAIYLDSKLVHIGQTGNTLKYLRRICLQSNTFLLINLARRATGKTIKNYRKGSLSIESLLADPVFASAVESAHASLQNAKVRLVAIPDPRKRTLIHAFAQEALSCPHIPPR